MEKKCYHCKEVKNLSDFTKNKSRKDGYHKHCRMCSSEFSKKYRMNNPEKYREYLRQYMRNLSPEIRYTRFKKWILNNKEKYRQMVNAHQRVGRAIKKGFLIRQPCEVCGKNEKIQAHHDNYLKPLDIRWLCSIHHKEADLKSSKDKYTFGNYKKYVQYTPRIIKSKTKLLT